jgi:hypothetical protein
MKTIAISIEEDMAQAIRRVAAGRRLLSRTGRRTTDSVSAVIREAVAEYLRRLEKTTREAKDREAYRHRRKLVNRQAAETVADQEGQ